MDKTRKWKMRLIDADELCADRVSNDPVVIAAKCAPTIDAEPVRHGEWILNPCNLYNDATWVCSVCGNEWVLIDGNPHGNQMNYCPNCGAKMDGGTKTDVRND